MDYDPVVFTPHTGEVFHVKITSCYLCLLCVKYIVQIILDCSTCLIPASSHKIGIN